MGVTHHSLKTINHNSTLEQQTLLVELNSKLDVKWLSYGENVNLKVKLIAPIAVEVGTKFSIREGGNTVGAGSVTKIVK
ncbi:hypothetical protein NW072_02835 [Mycoplasmopsis felis]|uniref:EF-Tu C-terminal domain-related protein n=1 Tax=Mycoplasmopsis felis TaxID=33923 RepID=UPI0021B0381B|nr:hypothetical protein [Mycoplasmopsis felis]UWV80175.1 hypothetical protein NW072_02835 [Mycoplasmopsis felis]